jgi:sulfane dehydrogenase subunit SoxC
MSGELTRRELLAAIGAGVGLAAVASAEDTPRPTVPDDASKVLGAPTTPTSERSPFETPAVAPIGNVSGPAFSPVQQLQGTITPTDLQFQRHHGGIAQIDPERWRLLIHGHVERPLVFSLEDLKRFPSVSRVCFLECSGNGRNAYRAGKPEMTAQQFDGLVSNLEWTGVPLALVLREAGVKPEATWMVAEGGDASLMARSIPIAKALDDALIVWAANGEPLRPAHGYPARLLLPGWEANTSIKWLRRLELVERPLMSKDETVKYTDPLPGDRARQFSFVMDAKSLITEPSYPRRLSGPGWWPVTGIAWTGRGKITRVDVSTDGGRSWEEAELQEPVLSKALVRFRHMWRWEGGPAVLMSRATDETGYVQPTLAAFRAARGVGTDFHFNHIRAWRVQEDGQVFYLPDPEAA